MKKFLVTGANGHIALHVIDRLIKDGYFVRGTVKNINKKIIEPILKLASKDPTQLELVELDFMDVNSWKFAVENIDIIIHFTNPYPLDKPSDSESVIGPILIGTLHMLNVSLNSTVRRIVVNSCCTTIISYEPDDGIYSEKDWADVNYFIIFIN